MANHMQVQPGKGEETLTEKRKLRGGCYKQKVHWRKQSSKYSGFLWLSCDSLSLVELLPGEGKTFLPPAGGGKVVSLPAANARYGSSRL